LGEVFGGEYDWFKNPGGGPGVEEVREGLCGEDEPTGRKMNGWGREGNLPHREKAPCPKTTYAV